jgi:glc operon protein GlcG
MNEIVKLIEAIEKLIPEYMADPVERNVTNGSLAVCIIDEAGNVYGKLMGKDVIRTRQSYKIAWTKASQVWITGFKTGEYEKLVFTCQIDEHTYGISRPDLIGWEGGQPITLKSGKKLSVGFSGFRGVTDLEIVTRALQAASL